MPSATVQATTNSTRHRHPLTGFHRYSSREPVRKAAWGDLPDMVARTVTEMYPTTEEALQKAMRESRPAETLPP